MKKKKILIKIAVLGVLLIAFISHPQNVLAQNRPFNKTITGHEDSLVKVTGNIETEADTTKPTWIRQKSYQISIKITLLTRGNAVDKISEMTIWIEFYGEGGELLKRKNYETDPSEIVWVNSPVNHKITITIPSEAKGLPQVVFMLYFSFKEVRGGLHRDYITEEKLDEFTLNIEEPPSSPGFGVVVTVLAMFTFILVRMIKKRYVSKE